jgi:predicted ATP-dependent protease
MQDTDLHDQKRVAPEKLARAIDPQLFDFDTTEDIEPLVGTIGQDRATEAIDTGLDMAAGGFNIFASGLVGTGRTSTILAKVRARAEQGKVPSDWCYVHNFETPDEPNAIELPAGYGRELASDMEDLIRACREQIPKVFEGEEYERRKAEALHDINERRNALFQRLQEKAQGLDHAIRPTPQGLAAVPMVDGETVSPDEFEQLDEETQKDLREKSQEVQKLVAEFLPQARTLEKEARETAHELDQEVALFAIGHLIQNLAEKYADFPEVTDYLKRCQDDIVDNVEVFKGGEQASAEVMGMKLPVKQPYTKYRVNVVVDHSRTEGAPVVDERNPTYYNLFGQLEYRSQFGGMTTDFTMIKAGAMQQASGGYLVLHALDVLRNPFAWEGLQRALRTRQVKIENMWEQYRPIPAATLRPEPIPVQAKVILVGSPLIYHLLYTLDEDFRRLFKIKADFDVEMDFTEGHVQKYARFVQARCQEAELPAFDRSAVARIAEHGVRHAGHQERLSTCFLRIADLVAEAGQQAKRDDTETVTAEHVDSAIQAHRRRSRMLQDKLQRLIEEDTLLIDTEDAVPGQANGLSVYDLGDYQFGRPTRITCVTSVGRAGVVNIERESKMSGRIHNKGVLILTGYLARRFGQDKPLSLSASLCFEQSYGQIEGDSASCTELYTLLSSLADLPLRQDIAVTGSVNQRGQVQPIGGVNEKIEGFFEVCKAKGLTGTQGVLIPARNLHNLGLDAEVVQAVRDGQFHIYAVHTVEEGIELLTGVPAGERGGDGSYPEDSVYGRADRRLREIAGVLKEFGAFRHAPEEEEDQEEEDGE